MALSVLATHQVSTRDRADGSCGELSHIVHRILSCRADVCSGYSTPNGSRTPVYGVDTVTMGR